MYCSFIVFSLYGKFINGFEDSVLVDVSFVVQLKEDTREGYVGSAESGNYDKSDQANNRVGWCRSEAVTDKSTSTNSWWL